MTRLDDIGFYTLSDERALNTSITTPLHRCELILSDVCNFSCSYCRGLRQDIAGELPLEKAQAILDLWISQGLINVRFSGGEPCLYQHLPKLIKQAVKGEIKRIAVSTNGSMPLSYYQKLIQLGVNDYSVSLDGCCASVGDAMSRTHGKWETVVNNIRELSKLTYVTVGIVFTEKNVRDCGKIVLFADSLGVSDIRVIPSAQYNQALTLLSDLPDHILIKYPILRYRINNLRQGKKVRGIRAGCLNKCRLVLDDMAVARNKHFPCIIYLREGGAPIGQVGQSMRVERRKWMEQHDPASDSICKEMCLDVCVDYNKVAARVTQ